MDRKLAQFFKEGGKEPIDERLESEEAGTPMIKKPDLRMKYGKE